VKSADGTEGVVEMLAAATVIAKDPPVLETRDRVLDARSASARRVADAHTRRRRGGSAKRGHGPAFNPE